MTKPRKLGGRRILYIYLNHFALFRSWISRWSLYIRSGKKYAGAPIINSPLTSPGRAYSGAFHSERATNEELHMGKYEQSWGNLNGLRRADQKGYFGPYYTALVKEACEDRLSPRSPLRLRASVSGQELPLSTSFGISQHVWPRLLLICLALAFSVYSAPSLEKRVDDRRGQIAWQRR